MDRLDVGKDTHFAEILDNDGDRIDARQVGNDEVDLDVLLETASGHGVAGLVIDQPGSIAQLAIAVAARRGVPVAYVPGLLMRRAADLTRASPTGCVTRWSRSARRWNAPSEAGWATPGSVTCSSRIRRRPHCVRRDAPGSPPSS